MMDTDHHLYKEFDLSQYISTQELEALSSQQQNKLKTFAINYEIMLYMGLPAIKPDFLTKNISDSDSEYISGQEEVTLDSEGKEEKKTPDIVKNDQSMNTDLKENDQTLILALESKKTAKGKDNPSRNKCKNADPMIENVKHQLLGKKVQQIKDRKSENIMRLDEPFDDQSLYCDECNKEYDTDCPVHGPLEYIKDTQVSAENDPERALLTIPPGLVVRKSSIVGAGFGVFTEKEIPPRVMFGPYDGKKLFDELRAHDSGNSWQICESGKCNHYVDGKDTFSSNWMKCVNCARTESEQNLTAFQFKGDIYYRSYKTIHPGAELLCWYGNEYGRELSILRDKNLMIRPKVVNGQECYPCAFCETAFTSAVYNVRHLVRGHGKRKLTQGVIHVLKEWLRENDTVDYSRKWPKKIRRTNCGKSCVNHQGKNREQANTIEQNIPGNENDVTLLSERNYLKCDDSNHLKNHTRIHTKEKSFKCDLCDYVCKQKGLFETHMRRHTGEKPFKCDKCDYASVSNENLKEHRKIHDDERRHKCQFCDFACNQRAYLYTHITLHTGEKRFKCNDCDFASNTSYGLKCHMRKHTGEKRFMCEFCGYLCNQGGELKRHIRIHIEADKGIIGKHGKIQKHCRCDLCGYVSYKSNGLRKHLRAHTGVDPSSVIRTHEKGHQCKTCSYSCSSKFAMQIHMRIHTGEKPYECDVCDYKSRTKCNLKRHIASHMGQKPFKCGVCDFGCTRSTDLKRHKFRHTLRKKNPKV